LDADGLSNLEEYELGTLLDNSDSDGDGMGDAVEIELGTSPLISDAWNWESDTDGDGYTLEQEIAFGTDPTDALDSGQNQTAITSKIVLGDSNLLRSYWDYTLKLAGPERTFSIESSAGNTTTETILLRKGQTYKVSLSRTPEVDLGDQYPYGQGVPFVSSITSTNTALFIEEESEHSILTDHSGDAGTMDSLFDTYWNGTSLVSRETLHAKVHILNIAMERAGNALSNNGYTFISATAQMPDVTAKILPEEAPVSPEWSCSIVFDRPNRNENKSFPSSNEEWSLRTATGGTCYGGQATLTATLSDVTLTNIFHIRGINPSEAEAETEIGDEPFYAKAIARHESGTQNNRTYLQFNDIGESGTLTLGTNYLTDLKYTPNRSSDGMGWGMFQLTNPEPSTDEVWNWKSNVSGALQRMERKETDAQSYFNAVQRTYTNEWEIPPTSYIPPGCSTSLTALEAATLQLFNGGAVREDLLTPYGTPDLYTSCWRFLPNNPSGQRWEFVANSENYVWKVINEYENP
jgi:hypothetical protein